MRTDIDFEAVLGAPMSVSDLIWLLRWAEGTEYRGVLRSALVRLILPERIVRSLLVQIPALGRGLLVRESLECALSGRPVQAGYQDYGPGGARG
jgi:hypothetical protein